MAASFERTFIQDLNERLDVHYRPEIVFSNNNLSNVIHVRLYRGTAAYSEGGTVSATCIRSDGKTVPILNGSISDNVVTVSLIKACMVIPGPIQVFINLSSGDVNTTIFKGVFSAEPSETDAVIDPGDVISGISDLINTINEAVESIPPDYSALVSQVDDLKSDLDKYNAMNVLPPRDDTSGTVGGNVTYSCTNGWHWTFSGTSTSNVNRNLLQEASSIPEWFKPGNVLRIRLNKTGQMDDVRLVIYAYDGVNPTLDDRYMQTFEDVDYVVPELKDKPGLMIRLYIASGCTVDGTVYPQIVQGMPNAEIVESLESLQANEIKYVAHPETAYPGKTLAEINDNIVCMPARSTYPAPDTAASGPYIIVRYVNGYNLHIQVSNSSGKVFTRIVKRSDSSIYRDWVGLVAESELNDYLLKYVAIGRFANKKIYCDGDSIMVGVITTSPEYPSRTIASPNISDAIAARLPNATVDNKAHGGDYIRSMNDASVSICDSILSDNTVSGYDYFVINGGTNDYTNDRGSNPTTLGTIDSTDTATFYGAYNAIMQYIFSQNPKARVLLITPCFRNYMHSTRGNAYEIQNEQGITLGDFCDAVIDIGKKYAVPVYDSRVLGPINEWNYTTLLVPRTESGTDAHIHPSQDGYTLYGNSIASYFIANN